MKKITFVSLMSFLFLSLCSLFEYLFRMIPFEKAWIPLVIGIGYLILSGIIAILVKKNIIGNIFCFILNSAALGFCIRAWYMFRNYDNPLWVMVLVSIACVVYLLIFYFSLYIPFFEKHINIYIWVFLIVTLVVYLIVMFESNTTYVSTFGYFVIIEIAFILAMCNHQYTLKYLFRDVVVSTYSVLIVAIIIALIMFAGDGLDGLDGFDIGPDGLGGGIQSPRRQKVLTSGSKIH